MDYQTLDDLSTLHKNTIWRLEHLSARSHEQLGFAPDEPQVNYRFLTSFFLRKLIWADGVVHPAETDMLRAVLDEQVDWAQEVMIQEQVASTLQHDSQFAPTLGAAYHDYLTHIHALHRLELLRDTPSAISAPDRARIDASAPLFFLAAAGKHLIASDHHIAHAELVTFNEGIGVMCDVLEARGGSLESLGTNRAALLIAEDSPASAAE
jgi:uncharacterized tellurite resistance protein B-like protein